MSDKRLEALVSEMESGNLIKRETCPVCGSVLVSRIREWEGVGEDSVRGFWRGDDVACSSPTCHFEAGGNTLIAQSGGVQ